MKKILITGASQGIGKAIAIEYSKREKNIFSLISRNESALLEVKSIVEKNGSSAFIFPCDIRNIDSYLETLKKSNDLLNGIDLAFLNAGISQNHFVSETDYYSSFENTYKVNVFPIAASLEFFAKTMKKNKGKIVIVSSLADIRGFPSSSAYSSSKSALTRLAEAARVELKNDNIKVITVRPGFIETNMTAKNKFPMPFLMKPEKAAKIIIKGIEKDKTRIYFPFPMVVLTKTISMLPDFLYEYLVSFYKKYDI
ncbi:MAG: SDR family NAD(P)-dependent oxidoreductase [Ignavibacteria bacterium]|nr:SDR family NAD(P)-dependent oxidoreductase [Ignavibacteria bacterium]